MYMFLKDSHELVTDLGKKYENLYSYYSSQGMYERFKRSYNAYYNYSIGNTEAGNSVGGEQGEFVTTTVNHFRNIIKHIYTLTTQNRLVFDALAENNDVDSIQATKIANDMLDYYFYHRQFDAQCKSAFELSLIFGTAYLGVIWEPNVTLMGQDEHGFPVYKGAPRFKYFSPFDVIMEAFKDDPTEQTWCVTREYANKWDLCAAYPEIADQLESLPRIRDLQNFVPFYQVDEDTCWLFKAYHKPTPALPNGRYTVFCEGGLLISDDMVNPYGDELPIIACIPEKRYGGSFGHTVAFDLIGLQDSVNFLHSTILSNQQAFGSQNIAVSDQADVNPEDIPGGLKLMKYKTIPDDPHGGAPFALNLVATPAEIFRYADTVVGSMEAISAVNGAQRGSPGHALNSGTAIALVTAQAQSYNSDKDQAYIAMCEKAATKLVWLCKYFVPEEELMSVVGKFSKGSVVSFKGSDLDPVKQVKIYLGNPLAKTLSGRLEIANQLLQGGQIKSIPQYLQLLETGDVEGLLDEETAEESLIDAENEEMLGGGTPIMLWTDNHIEHIRRHKVRLCQYDVRKNPKLNELFLAHIQSHMDQIESSSQGNPMALAISLNQPIPTSSPGNNVTQGAMANGPGGPPAAGQPPPGAPAAGSNQASQAKPEPPKTLDKQTAKAAEIGGAQAVAGSAMRRAEKQVGAIANAQDQKPI